MGHAALALKPQPKPTERARMDIHEELDKWLDVFLPEIFKDGREPTLEEMSDLITQTRQQFMGEWLPILIRESQKDPTGCTETGYEVIRRGDLSAGGKICFRS